MILGWFDLGTETLNWNWNDFKNGKIWIWDFGSNLCVLKIENDCNTLGY
jgi:hypothetical protein